MDGPLPYDRIEQNAVSILGKFDEESFKILLALMQKAIKV